MNQSTRLKSGTRSAAEDQALHRDRATRNIYIQSIIVVRLTDHQKISYLDQISTTAFGLRTLWRLPRRDTQPETALGVLESRHKLRYRDTSVGA